MEELNDRKLKSLLKDSRVEMPFSDFETKLMTRVKSELHGRRSVVKSIRLSWLFFVLGAFFGLVLNILLPWMPFELAGISLHFIKYPILLITLVVIIWQLDEMIRLTLRHKRQKRLS
ncbi:hypothetical protein KEM09_08905 [Carboxylicivirga mesophila]|uniref:Cation-transporting P-type ATPase C-terminal domain-containing protein n=1 Tax=Carboxylicivirga mesophila TaxID=1166478 RepID=A0ABS5KAZ6_9BACT|nr:hypothetical protein [Carboxylicivirga mesophila]MBS2211518.1 hypothetical protein [Carboxylicivirga mesophila]